MFLVENNFAQIGDQEFEDLGPVFAVLDIEFCLELVA